MIVEPKYNLEFLEKNCVVWNIDHGAGAICFLSAKFSAHSVNTFSYFTIPLIFL